MYYLGEPGLAMASVIAVHVWRITPLAAGVSVPLWLGWQLAILLSSTALIVPTAALFRGVDADGTSG